MICLLSFALFADDHVLEAAKFSHAVYQPHPDSEKEVILDHENLLLGNRLLVAKDEHKPILYFAIRGTGPWQNWFANAHIANDFMEQIMPDWLFESYQKVKQGPEFWFRLAFRDLKEATLQILARYPNHRLVITGHSYGGVMANLLAQDIAQLEPKRILECHTFNAPGTQEIREKTLKLPTTSAKQLQQFYNHLRISDPIAWLNTHEGHVVSYPPAARFESLTDEHKMELFLEDLRGS